MPAILTKIREQASRVQPSIALGVGVGVALAACAVYGTRDKKHAPPCNNNNNYKEDADETQSVEEHIPGLNLEFLRQLISLARIMVPGIRSHEVAILSAHTLCLFTRTFLSIYVASLEGSIVKHIVQKDMRRFAMLLLQWFGIAVPATFINSMIRYLESRLALAFRTRLVNHAYELYFKNQTYYRVANLDARIENADHRLTEDVSVFTQSVAHLYSSLTKPCFDLLLIVLTLATYSNKMKGNIFIGPSIATVVICMTGQLLRMLSPKFGALAGEEARMKANLRHVHARLIAHAEEVAFYGGHKVELGQLQAAYKELVAQMTSVFNKKLWYVMLEQFCMKYVWSGTGMVMLALPILTASHSQRDGSSISDRAEYMTTSRNLLNSAADAIERLMSSYKEIVTLAGYATRVSDMLVVFREVARGRCVRAVHVAPHAAFRVTLRDNAPVPEADLSPYVSVRRPYMSQGSLIDQVTYPSRAQPDDNAAWRRAAHILRLVRLDACAARHGGLGAVRDWRATLSGGEKQRMAMARMFYHRKYHTHVLEFDGCGNWSYRPLDKDTHVTTALPSIAPPTTNPTPEAQQQEH
ncbi:hypothetical protein HF086_016507 [Spodoptera exigua]|uniref:ABC transmembrane type-1 domain-containing protein n=1 Tax=Spodoptera exigua TaxID=7107 RepID=A0A922MWV2_SPOEX|nr:hypothetical protein HF086_016507 [Spodoptera exigua]